MIGGYDGTENAGRLLAVGVRGTLEPDTAVQCLKAGERLTDEELPPLMEDLLTPWLTRAVRELATLREGSTAQYRSEPIPLDALRRTLKLHLAELMAQAVDDWLNSKPGKDGAEFWQTYPALRSVVANSVRDWAAGTALFFQRWGADRKLLAECMGQSVLPEAVPVVSTSGDLHPGGARTLRIGFAGGGCVYYKPRAVSGEWLWQVLLDTTAGLDGGLQLPAGRIVQGSRQQPYGWMESLVEGETWPGSPKKQASRLSYWESAGVLLCLAQHVCLTDLHLGNILATELGPAVTDAECLGTAVNLPLTDDGFKRAAATLLGTGLLPHNSGRLECDVSGLFGRAGPVAGIDVSRWVVSRTGSWRLASIPAALVRHGNLRGDAGAARPRAVAAELCAGYRAGADLLMRARASLLASGSVWRSMLETVHAPRYVLRETLFYGKLLSQSLRPQYLCNEHTRRELILAALSSASTDVPRRVVKSEARAIAAGSIPRLIVGPASHTLSDTEGRKLWRNRTADTPAAAVMRGMEALTETQLEQTLLPALLAAVL